MCSSELNLIAARHYDCSAARQKLFGKLKDNAPLELNT